MDDQQHDLTPGAGHGLPDDDPTVRAFRSALGGAPARVGSRDPRTALAGIERRARTHQRRRFAGTTALAVAGLAVVVAVTPLALGGSGADTSASGSAAASGPGEIGAEAQDGSSATAPSDDPGASQLWAPAAAAPLTADSLLRPEDVDVFGAGTVAAVTATPTARATSPSAGVCVDEPIAADQPTSALTTSFAREDAAVINTLVVEGVSQTVLRWDAQAGADAFVAQVRAAGDRCVEEGTVLEGVGPYERFDPGTVIPAGVTAQVFVADGGNGGRQVVAVLSSGNTATVILATLATEDDWIAGLSVTFMAAQAAPRAFVDASAPIATGGPDVAPAPDDGPTDDSMAAS